MLPDEVSRAEVRTVVTGFFVSLDGFDDDRALAYLTEDVEWIRGSGPLRGHAEVRDTLAARPRGRCTRHLVNNLDVCLDGPDAATARCDILVFQGQSNPDGSPVTVTGPDSIISNEDRLVRIAGRWRIRSKRPVMAFRIASSGTPSAGG